MKTEKNKLVFGDKDCVVQMSSVDHLTRDLLTKCVEDISASLIRNMSNFGVGGASEVFTIVSSALFNSLGGFTVTFMESCDVPPEEVARFYQNALDAVLEKVNAAAAQRTN